MPSVTIDERRIEVALGQTILDAARRLGITIPTLCYHPDLSTVGSCRLCLVDVNGVERQLPACSTPVMDQMVVHTETTAVVRSRRQVLRLLLNEYYDPELTTAKAAETEFLRWVRHYDVKPAEQFPPRFKVDSDPHPLIQVDLNKCILCTRCIRACNEVQGRFVWHLAERGQRAHIVSGTGTNMLDANCESCGACAAYCPTGALADRNSLAAPYSEKLVKTTCGYCGVGCQFDLNVVDNRVIRVTSNPAAPVNGMALCVKGRYGFDYIHHPDRLKSPRVRAYLLSQPVTETRPADRGGWIDVDWDTAIQLVAKRLSCIRDRRGSSAIGVLSSAKCTNEENYLVQKLARQLLRTNNVDHCARLCHSSTVSGLTMAFGSGAMSNSMDDVAENSAALFVIGSNTTEQHPVFGSRLRQAVLERGAKLVVADPRRVDIAEIANVHLRHRPGTDVALLNGLMHLIVRSGGQDQAFIDARCDRYDEFAASLDRYPPVAVSQITGVPVIDLERAVEIFVSSRPMAAIWAMGITQHRTGVLNVLAMANLQMLLGKLGIAGGGVNPLRGQNNVQGACDMGSLPNVFPGYQSTTDSSAAKKFNTAWELSELAGRLDPLPSSPGLTVTEMIDAAGVGKIHGLYMVGEDPVMTEPDVNHVRRCLERCEFLVLQEIFPSETSAYADVLLPGASFAEKDGTFTNTERRVQRVVKAIDPVGAALADWQIIASIGQELQQQLDCKPQGPWAGWEYRHPSDIMLEIGALTPSMAGVTYERLDHCESLQWPVPSTAHPGTPILHASDFPRGRGLFHVVDHLEPAERPNLEYPLILTTGRVLYHWHGGEMSRRVDGLLALCPESMVEVSPEDAAHLGLETGMPIRVTSRRGEMVAHTLVTERVGAGILFGNFHFPQAANVNNLTIKALDPVAKIPEYKVCAVRLERLAGGEVSSFALK